MITVNKRDGFPLRVLICEGRTLRATQYFGDRGDLVREDLYSEGLLRLQLFYRNGKLSKMVPIDEAGNPIEDKIVIIPIPFIRPY